MRCNKSSMVSHSAVRRVVHLPRFNIFIRGTKAASTILVVMLFPVLLSLMTYFENIMEVKYVTTETQALWTSRQKAQQPLVKGSKRAMTSFV